MKTLRNILILLSLFWTCCVLGAEFQLGAEFTGSEFDYAKAIDILKNGDRVCFNDDCFTLQDYLGRGSTNIIFAISESEAIRIPLKISDRHFVGHTLRGHEKLDGSRLPHVRVNANKSRAHRFVIVERIDVEFTMLDWLSYIFDPTAFARIRADHVKIRDAVNRFDMFVLLLEFVKSSYQFSSLSVDFSPRQVGFVKGSWVLLDWTDDVRRARNNDFLHAFSTVSLSGYRGLPNNINELINNEVMSERKRVRACSLILDVSAIQQ